MGQQTVADYFQTLSESMLTMEVTGRNGRKLSLERGAEQALQMILDTRSNSGKALLVGNGGSSAMASHVAVDFTKAAGIRAINFNEADLITCFANDYGYENWVAQALEAYADQGELLILISSSGNSQNILNGAKKAKEMGLLVITLSGFLPDNPLRKLGNLNLWVDSSEYNIVASNHINQADILKILIN